MYPDMLQYRYLAMGVMYHKEKRGRGVHIRGAPMKYVLLRANCTYQHMLTKCAQETYPEEDQRNFDFFIADSRGVAVWNGDNIEVDIEETRQEKARM